MADATYSAESIQVLSGLEPVRRRPGMYTDTTRPNHLVQEVVDNSVDEALAGHARQIDVVLCRDGAVEVTDDGRGMPHDVLVRAIEPFFTTQPPGSGTGLGLSTLQIVGCHNIQSPKTVAHNSVV
jgi:DNA gyrase/topoisomerase IV subunit B